MKVIVPPPAAGTPLLIAGPVAACAFRGRFGVHGATVAAINRFGAGVIAEGRVPRSPRPGPAGRGGVFVWQPAR